MKTSSCLSSLSMEQEGWDVRPVSSAEEAKTAAANDRPDLIVMDIIMGGEHGYSAIEELKSNPQLRSVPVIVFSGVTHRWSETTATREDALLSEAVEFVDKTDEPDVLIRTIRRCIAT